MCTECQEKPQHMQDPRGAPEGWLGLDLAVQLNYKLQSSGTRLCKPVPTPPGVQNIISSSGMGSRNEIEIKRNFSGDTPFFFVLLALPNFVGSLLTRPWGKEKASCQIPSKFWKQQEGGRAFYVLFSSAVKAVLHGSDSAQLEQCMSHICSAHCIPLSMESTKGCVHHPTCLEF